MSSVVAVPASSVEGRGAAALLLRRPLLLLLLLGCAVSLFASGRFTARLVVDGMVSFAFIPVCQVLGLAAVYPLRARRAMRFAEAVDGFFAGNTAWLCWILAAMAAVTATPVLLHGRLLMPLLVSTIVPIGWSAAIDVRFFREAFGHTGRRVALDLTIERLVSWSAWWLYFFGAASDWRLLDTLYIFVEAWDMLRTWTL